MSRNALGGRLGEGGFPEPGYLTWKDRKETARRKFFDNSLKMEHTGFSIWDQTEYLSTSTTEDHRSHPLKGAEMHNSLQVRPRQPSSFLHQGSPLSAISSCMCNTQEVLERVANGAHWQVVRD